VSPLPRLLYEAALPGLGRPLEAAEGVTIGKYLNMLTKWQRTHRLVGSIEPAWLVENVILDSLCFLEALPQDARTVGDLGSGAGLPGIPIAIVRPDLRLTLIEARQRRASFLSTVVRELGLDHVTVVAARAETLGDDIVGRLDSVVMRCAGRIDDVLGVALRLVRPGGRVIVGSGPSAGAAEGAEEMVVRTPTGTLRTFHRYVKRP